MWWWIGILFAAFLEVLLVGLSYLIPDLPDPWPTVFVLIGIGGLFVTVILAIVLREYRFPLRERRRRWKPSQKCIDQLREAKPEDGMVILQSHDAPSHYLAESMKDAFKSAGWKVDYDKKSTWADSPQLEGIKIYGGSDHTVSKVVRILSKCGLKGIQVVMQPDSFTDRWETIEFKLAIWDE